MFFKRKWNEGLEEKTNQEMADEYKINSLDDIQSFIDADQFHKTRFAVGGLLLYTIIKIVVKELIIIKRRLNNVR